MWSKWAWPIMILSIVLLLIIILPFTESIAPRIRGSRRFLFGASLQPSELGKIAVIVWTSMLVVKKGDALQATDERTAAVSRGRRRARHLWWRSSPIFRWR